MDSLPTSLLQLVNHNISFSLGNATVLLETGATVAYDSDPTRPIGRWKEAWEAAKIRAGVQCRFHDLRHTGCTRMLEPGVPFSVVATIMGWSPSTTVRMSRRYGHIGQTAQRHAVNALNEAGSKCDGAQNWAQSQTARTRQ